MTPIAAEPLTAAAFAPFGDVIAIDENGSGHLINAGTTERFDLSTVTASGTHARVRLSMVRASPFALPLDLALVERHPHGSQAFVPVRPTRFLVVVAPDLGDRPGAPRAFLAAPGQGINYRQGTWHGVLTALDAITDFVVVDRVGDEPNCDVFHYPAPYRIKA